MLKDYMVGNDNDYASKIQSFTNLNLNLENITEFSDSKGVFFDEGEVLLKFQYSNKEYKALKDKISSKEHWKKLPIKSLSAEDQLCDDLLSLNFVKPKKGRNHEKKEDYFYFYLRFGFNNFNDYFCDDIYGVKKHSEKKFIP